jgi:hypothetical protein
MSTWAEDIWKEIREQLREQLSEQLTEQLRKESREQRRKQLRKQLREQLREQLPCRDTTARTLLLRLAPAMGSFAPLFAIFEQQSRVVRGTSGNGNSSLSSHDPLTTLMLFLGRRESYAAPIPLSEWSAACLELRRAREALLAGQCSAIVEPDFYGSR